MAEFYVFLSNLDSSLLYPDNNANEFTVNLKKTILLEGVWSVGLKHIKCEFEHPAQAAHVISNICDESYVFNEYKPLLCVIHPKLKKYDEYFENPIYVPVKLNIFDNIAISIREGGELVKTTYCVLHFKQNAKR